MDFEEKISAFILRSQELEADIKTLRDSATSEERHQVAQRLSQAADALDHAEMLFAVALAAVNPEPIPEEG